MSALPDTRITLLHRLQDSADTAAWIEFCSIYERAIYNIAIRRGLQDADAREVSQEVLLSVSRRVHTFDPTREGKFRAWLSTIARNATTDVIRKAVARRAPSLPDDIMESLEAQPDDTLFDMEAKRELFRWAASRVQATTTKRAWQAFWLTHVEGRKPSEVAAELGMSIGTLYVTRFRVLTQIREHIMSFRQGETQ